MAGTDGAGASAGAPSKPELRCETKHAIAQLLKLADDQLQGFFLRLDDEIAALHVAESVTRDEPAARVVKAELQFLAERSAELAQAVEKLSSVARMHLVSGYPDTALTHEDDLKADAAGLSEELGAAVVPDRWEMHGRDVQQLQRLALAAQKAAAVAPPGDGRPGIAEMKMCARVMAVLFQDFTRCKARRSFKKADTEEAKALRLILKERFSSSTELNIKTAISFGISNAAAQFVDGGK